MPWFTLGFWTIFSVCLITGGTLLGLNPAWYFLFGLIVLFINKITGDRIP